MKFEHLIITRFSFRDTRVLDPAYRPRFFSKQDPLDPTLLRLRYKVFEMVCLPSLLAQTDQNFTWILMIDPNLDDRNRQRLVDLVAPGKRVRLHVFDPSDDLDRTNWLARYLRTSPDYLVTSILDSDDGLPREFVRLVRERVNEAHGMRRVPPFEILGSNRVVQWDIVTSSAAPLGWKASWHRHTDPLSCGFSLAVSYPRYPFSILGFEHRLGPVYFDLTHPADDPNVQRIRDAFGLAVGAAPESATPIWDFGAKTGPSIVTNHLYNDQRGRILEPKQGLEKVSRASSFPNVGIDWNAVERYAADFSGSNLRFLARRFRHSLHRLKRRSV